MKGKEKKNEGIDSLTVTGSKKKKKKKLIMILAIVVILAVIVGVVVKNMTANVEIAGNLVQVEPVAVRDLSDTISLKGTIAGESKTNVISKAVSEVTAVNVQVGDIVKEGDVLCTLDSATILEQIADLEKSLSNSQAVSGINNKQNQNAVEQARQDQKRQLEEAQKTIDQAQEDYNNAIKAYEDTMASTWDQDAIGAKFSVVQSLERALEAARTAYDTTLETTNRAIENAQIAAQLGQYNDSDSASKDTLSDLKEQLADCEIKAPCGGVVTAVNVSVGDMNTAKANMITIENNSSLKVVASVDESDILKIQEGMKAVITSNATGDEEISGTVSRVVRAKNQSSGSDAAAAGSYSVEVVIDNKDLLVGMAAKAKIMIQEKGEVLAIPYDLIQYDADGNAFVLVAVSNDDGTATAVRKNIEVGDEVDYYTEITGGDLKEGDMLIYDHTYSVVEGQTFAPEEMYSGQGIQNQDGQENTGTTVEVMVGMEVE